MYIAERHLYLFMSLYPSNVLVPQSQIETEKKRNVGGISVVPTCRKDCSSCKRMFDFGDFYKSIMVPKTGKNLDRIYYCGGEKKH